MRLNITNAEVGMRVRLTHPREHYSTHGANPKVGSTYECCGTVTAVNPGRETTISVRWDNGNSNSYHDDTLSLEGQWAEGNCESIW